MLTLDPIWGVAAALFLAGPVMWFFARRRPSTGGRRCGECGYDLAGATKATEHCPECGATLADAAIDTRLDAAGIRRRGRLRRLSGWSTVAGLVALLLLLLVDLRRIPVTPPAWLARVDARWAVRSPDTTSAAVFQRLVDLRCGGELSDADLRTAVDQILARIDQRNHGGAPARELIMHAWRDRVVTDEELVAIDGLWPVIELEPTSGTRSSMPISTRVDCGDFRVPIAKAGLGILIAWNEILVDGVSFASDTKDPFDRWPGPGLPATSPRGSEDAMPGPTASSPDRETVPAEIRMTVTLIDSRGRTQQPPRPRDLGVRGTTLATREIVVSGRLGIEDPGATRE